jgi:hypothetical protein
VKAGVLVHPCRLAVTGKTSGPSLYHLLEVLGKEKVMARIERALANFSFNTRPQPGVDSLAPARSALRAFGLPNSFRRFPNGSSLPQEKEPPLDSF